MPPEIVVGVLSLAGKDARIQTLEAIRARVDALGGIEHRVDLNRITGLVPLSWFTGRKHSGVDEAVKKG